MKYVIRKGSLKVSEYLQKNGKFGEYKTSKRFISQDAAENFATQFGISDFGIFPA